MSKYQDLFAASGSTLGLTSGFVANALFRKPPSGAVASLVVAGSVFGGGYVGSRLGEILDRNTDTNLKTHVEKCARPDSGDFTCDFINR